MKPAAIIVPATAVVSLASMLYQPAAVPPGGGAAVDQTASVVKGPAVETDYGTVTVAVAVGAGGIEQVRTVQYPTELPQSAKINRSALPVLEASALQAQSADIASVSGATYTSEGFKTSLAAALHRAGLG